MNISKSVAFVKADLNTLDFLQLKSYKLVEVWYKNELTTMNMVDFNEKTEPSIKSISNISSLPVFLLDSNRFMTVHENGRQSTIGDIQNLTSIDASNKTFWIKTDDKFFGVR